jgi:small subunit ribosomal protein S2
MPTTKTTKTKQSITPKPPVKMPELVDLLEAGVHFGHERSKKSPNMDSNIFMLRNRIAIIDLEKTQKYLAKAVKFLHQISLDPSAVIVFVGTKRQAREIVRKYAEATDMPYVTKRWLGGTLTNFSTVLKSIEKLAELKDLEGSATMEQMTKKERAVHNKSIERLEEVLEGIKDLKKLPTAIIVVGSHDEKLAVKEANKIGIPVIGITDTNANPKLVDYPIPANDDAIRAIDMIVSTMASAILTARGKSGNIKKGKAKIKKEK